MKYLVLMSGKINSGKNYYSSLLKEQFEGMGLSVAEDLFAKGLKDGCSEDFEQLSNVFDTELSKIQATLGAYFDAFDRISCSAEDSILHEIDKLKFKKHNFYEDKTPITRSLLQIYGTEVFRNRVDDNIWVKNMSDRINSEYPDVDVVIVTDLRFENELSMTYEYISDRRIVPIRINRNISRRGNEHTHPSECALDEYTMWEYIIDNSGTQEDLYDSSVWVADDILQPDVGV